MMKRVTPKICLAMIVRNEAAIIERVLASAKPLISSWRIIDTGSTDGTPELIERELAGIPGELQRSEWTDFGTNRSELVEWAGGTDDWLLLLDADMTVEVDDDFAAQLAAFESDAALVEVVGGVRYRMSFLVRSGVPWRYLGRTHEYLSSQAKHTSAWFNGLRVTHHGDGSSHAEKLERDMRLLGLDLEETPNDPRSIFYLAQTHKDLGNDERSRDLYLQRVELAGWDEEVFWSHYQAGILEERLGLASSTDTLAAAWNRRPTRAEPLYHLARIYRLRRQHHLSWVWSNVAAAIPKPEDTLFVEDWVYLWGAPFERADAAWRIGHSELAHSVATELLRRDDLPADHREHLEFILANTAEQVRTPID
jgi:glycosyltransferase involved in cell wall biosynthesis